MNTLYITEGPMCGLRSRSVGVVDKSRSWQRTDSVGIPYDRIMHGLHTFRQSHKPIID